MELPKAQPAPALTTAMVCAAAVGAQFVAGKAARDALFLANLDITALPAMVVTTAAFSIVLIALSSRGLRRLAPVTFVPAAFAVSAALLLVDWAAMPFAPKLAAQALYLQISGLGPMLGSGFWLIVTEHFDPHTARRTFGRIGAAGTISGIVGAFIADRIATTFGVNAMFPVLAVLNLLCAWQTRALARASAASLRPQPPEVVDEDAMHAGSMLDATAHLAATSPQTGLRALAQTPYLRNLAAFVLLSTFGATLIDYVFKAQAVGRFGEGEELLRFFAIYYAATAVLGLMVQILAGEKTLTKPGVGLGLATSTPPLALCVGGLGALAVPGVWTVVAVRGTESIFRSSLFRTGYEAFYTPLSPEQRRAAKSVIDVGFDRLGDALGAAAISLLLLLPLVTQYQAILALSVLSGAAAVFFAPRLNRGYRRAVEDDLIRQGDALGLPHDDLTTRTAMFPLNPSLTASVARESVVDVPAAANDPEIQTIVALRSRNREQILRILRQDEVLAATFVPHVIPLLAWDAVAEEAVRALRKGAEERLGALTDALLDRNQPFAVRRRLARVFSVCVSQRAVDALLLALDDGRFEVRYQCGRSLAAIVAKNDRVRIERERIFNVVRAEVAVSEGVWQSYTLLDAMPDERESFVDEFLKDRASQSLAHVFVLLSLVLPAKPLQIAYRGLHTDNALLRGTALEYLEGVLPPDIRERLWPFLGTGVRVERSSRDRQEVLDKLLNSHESIVINLELLRNKRKKTS